MQLDIYQVDAFAEKLFGGNPAAVVPLQEWLPDETMLQIAMENNLSETAFFVPTNHGFQLRWFTPVREVRLCGHATLATAHVLYQHMDYKKPSITFSTLSGPLMVEHDGSYYTMNFPADEARTIRPNEVLVDALDLGGKHKEYFEGTDDYLVILDTQEELQQLQPDFRKLEQLDKRGVIVTAPGETVDFVSRCFYPKLNILEDPVTGSAHTLLGPYWCNRLNQGSLSAMQLSKRVGHLKVDLLEARIKISGRAITYLKGQIHF